MRMGTHTRGSPSRIQRVAQRALITQCCVPDVTVELAEQEGLRFTSTVVGSVNERIRIGTPLKLAWVDCGGAPMAVFRTAGTSVATIRNAMKDNVTIAGAATTGFVESSPVISAPTDTPDGLRHISLGSERGCKSTRRPLVSVAHMPCQWERATARTVILDG
jgi:hypothetical protein